MQQIPRVRNLGEQEFVERYLKTNSPVIVTDAMDQWPAATLWTPQYLANELGKFDVLVYDELFSLVGVHQLGDYLARNFGGPQARSNEYVRWYSRLKHVDFFWADEAFARLKKDWAHPTFLPTSGYCVPACAPTGRCDATDTLFPYRGLFISGEGARTRLHRDPWTTSAVLCQFHGSKQVTMFPPDEAQHLMNDSEFADLSRPDLEKFPDMSRARASYVDVLSPGEILFIPSGWLHDIVSLSDSISVTWNFVHQERVDTLLKHIETYPQDPELEVLRFFVPDILAPVEIRI